MPHYNEFFFVPSEYTAGGDKLIESPPLICTSLKELAEFGWCLHIRHHFVRGYGYSKLRFHFYDPDNKGNPYFTVKMWKKGPVIKMDRLHAAPEQQEAENRSTLLDLFFGTEFKFSFTKQPVFDIIAQQEAVTKETIKYVVKEESELDFLQRMNEKRLLELRDRNTDASATTISHSQERLVG